MSTLFLRTLREDPADAEVPSHRLLVRGGYVRRVGPGIWSWLPLGYLVYRSVERIVREEMDSAGFQEVHFPALLPREPYEKTGRWNEYGDNLFRLQDRKKADYLLGPTHEEMFTLMVKGEYSSYKDLPLCIYHNQKWSVWVPFHRYSIKVSKHGLAISWNFGAGIVAVQSRHHNGL